MRVDAAYDARRDIHFQAFQQEHPEMDRQAAWEAFNAGWKARVIAASKSSVGGDLEVLLDWVQLYRADANRVYDQTVETYMKWQIDRRLIDALRTQILEMHGNPNDAPLYKRIANQRAEIKRLTSLLALQASDDAEGTK